MVSCIRLPPWQQQSLVLREVHERRTAKVTLAVALVLGGCHAFWLCGLIPTFLLVKEHMASNVDCLNPPCCFWLQVSRSLRTLPYVEPTLPTLALVGAPNVGKSSLVRLLSSGVPEVRSLPNSSKTLRQLRLVLKLVCEREVWDAWVWGRAGVLRGVLVVGCSWV
jgi:hypothetical protein